MNFTAMNARRLQSVASRFDSVDALRGAAMLWMTAYHFSFDLNWFGYIRQDFYRDPVWTWQRSLIVSLFLFCAGLGQAIAVAQGQSWQRFWQRWSQVAICALLVSASSYLMFPNSFIFFGILHGVAVMLILARASATWGAWLWLLGGLAMLLPVLASALLQSWASPELAVFFNSWQCNWLGLITHKPITEDYVPLLPWLGLMWWGLASGNWLFGRHPQCFSWKLPVLLRPLAVLGRFSLSYYMLHQPVLIGSLWLLGWSLQ